MLVPCCLSRGKAVWFLKEEKRLPWNVLGIRKEQGGKRFQADLVLSKQSKKIGQVLEQREEA